MVYNKDYDAILCKMYNIEGSQSKIISESLTIIVFGKTGIRYSGSIHEQPLKNGIKLRIAHINDVSLIIYHTGYSYSLHHKNILGILNCNKRIEDNKIDNQPTTI